MDGERWERLPVYAIVALILLTSGCLGGEDGEEEKKYDATIQFYLNNIADDERTHKIRISIIDLTRDGTDKDCCSQDKDYTVPQYGGSMMEVVVQVFQGDYDLKFYDYTVGTFHDTGLNLTEADPSARVTLFIYTTYMVTTHG
jgi:hypothetical protein